MLQASPCAPTAPPSPPPPWLCTALISDLQSCKTKGHLHQLHAKAIKTGQIRDALVVAEILRFSSLSGCRDLRYARTVFDQVVEPNSFSWNTIIRAFAESDDDEDPIEAILLFRQMLDLGSSRPNQYTFPSVLKACARIERVKEGAQIHGQAIKLGLDYDDFVVSNLVRVYAICGHMDDANKLVRMNSLALKTEATVILSNVVIDGYFRHGMVDQAIRVFDEMPLRSVISWNGMISRYAQIGRFNEAVHTFCQMQTEGVEFNYVTLVSVLPAISRLGALEMGDWVHSYAEKNGIEVDDVLGSALIDMYSKCGNIEKALQLFERLPKRNPITWSAMIGGLAFHGRAGDALYYFNMMELAGVTPSDVVFIGVLNACSHAGLVEQGREHFNRMVRLYGIEPRIEHYGCMVDLLGRAGHLDEAEELVTRMPMDPDNVVLKALVAACRKHRNVEMGIRVAKHLVELAPGDGTSYALLSSMYASVGDWDAVAEVRLMMKELGIRKDPGCSWITMDGTIHAFVVEDDTHPRSKEIYALLKDITQKLRMAE